MYRFILHHFAVNLLATKGILTSIVINEQKTDATQTIASTFAQSIAPTVICVEK